MVVMGPAPGDCCRRPWRTGCHQKALAALSSAAVTVARRVPPAPRGPRVPAAWPEHVGLPSGQGHLLRLRGPARVPNPVGLHRLLGPLRGPVPVRAPSCSHNRGVRGQSAGPARGAWGALASPCLRVPIGPSWSTGRRGCENGAGLGLLPGAFYAYEEQEFMSKTGRK